MIPPTRADPKTLAQLASQMRFPKQRLADLRAQAAANRIGVHRLAELAERHGLAELRDGMTEILSYAVWASCEPLGLTGRLDEQAARLEDALAELTRVLAQRG